MQLYIKPKAINPKATITKINNLLFYKQYLGSTI